MKEFLKNLKEKEHWQIFAVFAGFLFIIIGISAGIIIYQSEKISLLTAHQKSQSAAILNNLQVMNQQIDVLSKENNNSSNLEKIKNEIENIRTNLSTKNDVSKISSQITDVKNDMDTQFSSLEKNIAGNFNKTYLDEKVLPFKVISIDVISGQPFITVDYEHHQTALQIGDSLVNWKIISADYQERTVEFQNDKSQFVKVVLQG